MHVCSHVSVQACAYASLFMNINAHSVLAGSCMCILMSEDLHVSTYKPEYVQGTHTHTLKYLSMQCVSGVCSSVYINVKEG